MLKFFYRTAYGSLSHDPIRLVMQELWAWVRISAMLKWDGTHWIYDYNLKDYFGDWTSNKVEP